MALEHVSNNDVKIALGDSIVEKTKEEAIEIINEKLKFLNFSPRIFRRLATGETIEIGIQTSEDAWNVVAEGDFVQLEKRESSFLIKAVKQGKAIINATAGKLKNTMAVEVYGEQITPAEKPAKPVLTSSNTKIAPLGQLTLTVSAVEGVAFEASVPPSKGSVLVENNNIKYTAHNPGSSESVNVTIRAKKGNIFADEDLVVSVNVVVTTLSITPEVLNVNTGAKNTATVTTNASNFTVNSTNAEKVGAVKKGTNKVEVTGKAAGENIPVEIRATAEGGAEKTITLNVNVINAETTLEVTPSELTFGVGEQSEMVTINTDATDYEVTIEPSDAASFDKSSKKFTGGVAKAATATFTATAEGKNPKEAVINLTVQPRG